MAQPSAEVQRGTPSSYRGGGLLGGKLKARIYIQAITGPFGFQRAELQVLSDSVGAPRPKTRTDDCTRQEHGFITNIQA